MTSQQEIAMIEHDVNDVKPQCEWCKNAPATHYARHEQCGHVAFLCTQCVLREQTEIQNCMAVLKCIGCNAKYPASDIPSRIRDFPIKKL